MAFASAKSAPAADVRVAVEALLAERDQYVQAVRAIDLELQAIYERLASDMRPALPPETLTLVVLDHAVRVTEPVTPAASPVALPLPDRTTCAYDVLRLVLQTSRSPKELRALLPHWSADRIKHALAQLTDLGWLTRTGKTSRMRYAMVARVQAPAA